MTAFKMADEVFSLVDTENISPCACIVLKIAAAPLRAEKFA